MTPSDRDITHAEIEHFLSNLHTCMPGVVRKIYTAAGRQFVDVEPMLQRSVLNEENEEVDEAYPVIPHVPLAFHRGGGFFMSLPTAVGDVVTLIFAERSLDAWIEKAKRGGKAVSPGDIGMHPLDGAIAFPFQPASKPELLESVHATNLVIGVDGGTQIHVTPAGEIKLGSAGAIDPVALASKVHDAIAAMLEIGAAVPAPANAGFVAAKAAWAAGTMGGPPVTPAPPTPLPAPVGAAKVCAE